LIPGIFETVFPRPTLEETYLAVAAAGFGCVQGHLQSTGADPWSEEITHVHVARMAEAARAAGVRIPAIDGTFNMAHPDRAFRREHLARFDRVAETAADIGAKFVTLCTGTRESTSMWRAHPDNGTDAAWADMIESVRIALESAERHGVALLVEPEPANIASSAVNARRLLDEIGSDRLKIVLDPANVVLSDRSRSPQSVLEESFALLGPDIAFAHAKDLSADGKFCAAGSGIVPWERYWDLLDGIAYEGDVIFHTLTEADVPAALGTLNRRW